MKLEELLVILKSNGLDLVKENYFHIYYVKTACGTCALRANVDEYVLWGVYKIDQKWFSYKKHLNDITERYVVRHIIPEVLKTINLAMKEERKRELQKFKNYIIEE